MVVKRIFSWMFGKGRRTVFFADERSTATVWGKSRFFFMGNFQTLTDGTKRENAVMLFKLKKAGDDHSELSGKEGGETNWGGTSQRYRLLVRSKPLCPREHGEKREFSTKKVLQ